MKSKIEVPWERYRTKETQTTIKRNKKTGFPFLEIKFWRAVIM
jgi:hypothetical protein|tara:strand:+ start:3889 stop:4017 length:129 start_codon:yes stop_codon:yes gene_type:complete